MSSRLDWSDTNCSTPCAALTSHLAFNMGSDSRRKVDDFHSESRGAGFGRLHLRSHLFPHSMMTILESAWSRSSFSQRSTLSKVTAYPALQRLRIFEGALPPAVRCLMRVEAESEMDSVCM